MREPTKKKSWLIALCVVAFMAAFLLWLKFSSDSKIKRAVLKSLPLPIMLVENQPVLSPELIQRLSDYKDIYAKTDGFNEVAAKTKILERLELEAKYSVLARKKKASLSNWANFVVDLPEEKGNKSALKRAQESKAREDAFKFWFFSQKNLNSSAYEIAEHLKNELNNGADFGELSKNFNQGAQTRSLEGDTGPITQSALLNELKEPLLSAKQGQALALPSRLGVHLIQVYLKKISDSGEDVLYLKQIFLKGSDFDSWIRAETKDYKVINLINI